MLLSAELAQLCGLFILYYLSIIDEKPKRSCEKSGSLWQLFLTFPFFTDKSIPTPKALRCMLIPPENSWMGVPDISLQKSGTLPLVWRAKLTLYLCVLKWNLKTWIYFFVYLNKGGSCPYGKRWLSCSFGWKLLQGWSQFWNGFAATLFPRNKRH